MFIMGSWNGADGLGPLGSGSPGGVPDIVAGCIVTGVPALILLSGPVELGLVYTGVTECGDALWLGTDAVCESDELAGPVPCC